MRQPHFLVNFFFRLPSRQFLKANGTAIAPLNLGDATLTTAQCPNLLFSGFVSCDGSALRTAETLAIPLELLEALSVRFFDRVSE
jgi:hypothetical protein